MSKITKLEKKQAGIKSARIVLAGQIAAVGKPTNKVVKKQVSAMKSSLKTLVSSSKETAKQINAVKAFEKKAKETSTPTDRSRKALPPGKRTSRTGKTYYENRTNRADATRAGV